MTKTYLESSLFLFGGQSGRWAPGDAMAINLQAGESTLPRPILGQDSATRTDCVFSPQKAPARRFFDKSPFADTDDSFDGIWRFTPKRQSRYRYTRTCAGSIRIDTMRCPSEILDRLSATDETLNSRLRANSRDLTVRDIMSKEIITAASDDTLYAAAKRMSDNRVSCIVVVDDKKVVGILTDKDMLRGVAAQDADFRRMHVGELMSSPAEVAPPQTSVMAAGKIMETKSVKRLPVVDGDTLIGLVTQTDITRGLVSISPLTSVGDIMTQRVATVSTEATAAEAAQAMSSRGVSCLIAMHRGAVAGIITEKDLLRRVVALQKDPAATEVADVMSFPVVVVPPAYSILSAGKKIDRMRLHRLVVTADNKVLGIVTQTDIMRAVRRELERMEQQRRVLTTELDALVRYIMQDLEKLRSYLSETTDASAVEAGTACTTAHPELGRPQTDILSRRTL